MEEETTDKTVQILKYVISLLFIHTPRVKTNIIWYLQKKYINFKVQHARLNKNTGYS